jgi:hypothetical protein
LLTTTAGSGSGFFLVNFFLSTVFCAIKELDCEHVSSLLMALGLPTATASIGSGFSFLILFFQLYFELSMSLIVSM